MIVDPRLAALLLFVAPLAATGPRMPAAITALLATALGWGWADWFAGRAAGDPWAYGLYAGVLALLSWGAACGAATRATALWARSRGLRRPHSLWIEAAGLALAAAPMALLP